MRYPVTAEIGKQGKFILGHLDCKFSSLYVTFFKTFLVQQLALYIHSEEEKLTKKMNSFQI